MFLYFNTLKVSSDIFAFYCSTSIPVWDIKDKITSNSLILVWRRRSHQENHSMNFMVRNCLKYCFHFKLENIWYLEWLLKKSYVTLFLQFCLSIYKNFARSFLQWPQVFKLSSMFNEKCCYNKDLSEHGMFPTLHSFWRYVVK